MCVYLQPMKASDAIDTSLSASRRDGTSLCDSVEIYEGVVNSRGAEFSGFLPPTVHYLAPPCHNRCAIHQEPCIILTDINISLLGT